MFKPFYCCFGLFFRRTSFCSSRSVHPVLQAVLCSPCIANVLNFLIQRRPTRTLFLFEFSGFYILFNLWFSRFFVVVCLSSNSFSISDVVLFVNNFFNLFFELFEVLCCSLGTNIIIARIVLIVNNNFNFFIYFNCSVNLCLFCTNLKSSSNADDSEFSVFIEAKLMDNQNEIPSGIATATITILLGINSWSFFYFISSAIFFICSLILMFCGHTFSHRWQLLQESERTCCFSYSRFMPSLPSGPYVL